MRAPVDDVLGGSQFEESTQGTVLLVEGRSVQVLSDVSEVKDRGLEVREELHRDTAGLGDVSQEDEVLRNLVVRDVDLGLKRDNAETVRLQADLLELDGLVGV